ncbi:MAG: tRNA (N6-isopentenyl adenosine(37)-C2)-methylthiotransferase MiaB [Magnetococcus sp. DMHC-6]
MAQQKGLYIRTFGCQMNSYDSTRMADLLAQSHGYGLVEDPAQADLVIFNTCHIREKAEEKLFSELGRLRKGMRGKKTLFAVGGCVGQAQGELIFRRAPYVDLVFGPQNYHLLPKMLDRLKRDGGHIGDSSIPEEPKFDLLPQQSSTSSVASVTVQEGCDRFCAFCVVPYTRGREWSRPVEDILHEVTGLVSQGCLEVQLLGQNVNAYQGRDAEGVVYDLALLIRRVALVSGVKRIRFVTSHPADMNADLLEIFAELPELCPYLHLPLQSGSDRILQRMGRGHTVAEYLEWVDRFRHLCPDGAIASDFIVGFPGETEADFAETLAMVERVGFDHAYSFQYSPRPGTSALELDGVVSKEVGSQRLAVLQKVLNDVQLRKNRQRVGRIEAVLVEGASPRHPGEWVGRAPDFRRVNFPSSENLLGCIVSVKITEGLPNSLRGILA